MKAAKRTALLTAAVMAAGMTVLPVHAEQSTTDTFTYNTSDAGVMITGLVSEKAPSKLVIPEKIDGMPVIGIGVEAFAGHSEIMDISVPDSVYIIDEAAFLGARWYQAQPAGLVYAGNVVIAWKGRNRPDVIRLREGTTGIGCYAFGEGTGIENFYYDRYLLMTPLIVPKSIKYIAPNMDIGYTSWSHSWLRPGNIYYEGTEEEWHQLSNWEGISEEHTVYFESTEPDHEPTYSHLDLFGDVNSDGQVSILDVITLNRHLMIGEYLFDYQKKVSDIDGNGVPDETDALRILKGIVEIEPLPEAQIPDVDPKNDFYHNGYCLERYWSQGDYFIKYIGIDEVIDQINHTELTPHYEYKVYEGTRENGKVYQTIKLRDADIETLDAFAAAHFVDENTNAEKLYVTYQWIHYTNRYAYVGELWDTIVAKTYVDAIFNYQLGQCIQYNGAMAAMLAYMGYDVWMEGTPGVHWTTYVEIDGKVYNIECGNYGKNGEWGAFFELVER